MITNKRGSSSSVASLSEAAAIKYLDALSASSSPPGPGAGSEDPHKEPPSEVPGSEDTDVEPPSEG